MYNVSYGKGNINMQIYMYYFNKAFLSLKSAMTEVIDQQINIISQENRKNYLLVGSIYSALLQNEVERCIDSVIYFQALLETMFNDYIDFNDLSKKGSFKVKGNKILEHANADDDNFIRFNNYLTGYRKLRNEVIHPSSEEFDYKVYNIWGVYLHLKEGYEIYRFIINMITGSYCTTWEENLEMLQFPDVNNPIEFKSYNAASLEGEAHRRELRRLGRTDV